MERNRYPRKFYEWEPEGRRRIGRPRMRWRDNIKKFVEARGANLNDIEQREAYEDRDRLRDFIRWDY